MEYYSDKKDEISCDTTDTIVNDHKKEQEHALLDSESIEQDRDISSQHRAAFDSAETALNLGKQLVYDKKLDEALEVFSSAIELKTIRE